MCCFMINATLTVFSNFFINDKETLLRMQDSFMSFKDISAEKWVINIRGKFKLDAYFFLCTHLKEKLEATVIESGKGWFHDSKNLLYKVKSDYVFYWIEDHINMIDVSLYANILNEMKNNKCEHLLYSFYVNGVYHENMFKGVKKYDSKCKYIEYADLTKEINNKHRCLHNYYLISLAGIFSHELFSKLINNPDFRSSPKEKPHDFEKDKNDQKWLPIRYAIPKFELFASIDDTRGVEGYSLQERGLYQTRIVRNDLYDNKYNDLQKLSTINKILHKYLPIILVDFLRIIKSKAKGLKFYF